MDKDFTRMTDFLVGMGVEQVPHTHKSYLAHLIAVFRSLEYLGCPEDVCRAGMFHSIYGTERFQGFTLPLEHRAEVRTLIGDRAEPWPTSIVPWTEPPSTESSTKPPSHSQLPTASPVRRFRCHGTTLMTCVASTCLIGWNKSLARRSGAIAATPTKKWPSD